MERVMDWESEDLNSTSLLCDFGQGTSLWASDSQTVEIIFSEMVYESTSEIKKSWSDAVNDNTVANNWR